jgi:hypothetical protein
LKLGLQPPDSSMPALMLGDFLTGAVPAHPANADYLSNIQFGMYANDQFGVCGPTSVCNSRREITARLKGQMVAPSQEDCFDLYRRSGNPNFDPSTGTDDNGVNMQVMLQAVLSGGIAGVKCLGFAKVDTSNLNELQAAVAIFGFLLYGVNLQTAQQSQTNSGVWDYRPSGQWGGHAILGGAYVPNDLEVITWAQRVKMTARFIQKQMSEAWAVIWPEHLTDKGFLAGVDLNAFANAWQAITGKKFPVVVPPPAPTPTPTPTPTGNGVLTIDPVAKQIVYPAGWTAVQAAPSKDDFRIV